MHSTCAPTESAWSRPPAAARAPETLTRRQVQAAGVCAATTPDPGTAPGTGRWSMRRAQPKPQQTLACRQVQAPGVRAGAGRDGRVHHLPHDRPLQQRPRARRRRARRRRPAGPPRPSTPARRKQGRVPPRGTLDAGGGACLWTSQKGTGPTGHRPAKPPPVMEGTAARHVSFRPAASCTARLWAFALSQPRPR
jgi:hypothetical protein